MNVLSLFTGIGGLDLGLERAGMTMVAQVESDPWCRSILAHHWPEVPRHDDVRTTLDWWHRPTRTDHPRPRPAVDVVAGGFPCQPASTAGLGLGPDDPRWLWPAMAAVVADLRPAWVVAENVPGLHRRGLGVVHADLERLGYAVRSGLVTACALGAPHPRARLFVLAHPHGFGCDRRPRHERPARGDQLAHRLGWAAEPVLARMAHGVPTGLDRPHATDRRRALGNAVVPAVAEHIGRLITTTATDSVTGHSRSGLTPTAVA